MCICCHSYTIILNFDFSDLDTCFLHSMLHFTFALKNDFIEMWINKICGLIKYSFSLKKIGEGGINHLE